jgi:hypothetical protein
VISARVVATESLKSAIKRKREGLKSRCPKSKNPAIRYDKCSYTAWLEREEVSLSTVKGRQKFRIKVSGYFKQCLGWKVTSANFKNYLASLYKGKVWAGSGISLPVGRC